MATYKLKLQLSDGTEITAGTFTVPDGGGSATPILNIDFQDRTVSITQDQFQLFTNPALCIFGAVTDPDDGVVEYKVLRMTSAIINNDDLTETYTFENGTTKLVAFANTNIMDFQYEILGGY